MDIFSFLQGSLHEWENNQAANQNPQFKGGQNYTYFQ